MKIIINEKGEMYISEPDVKEVEIFSPKEIYSMTGEWPLIELGGYEVKEITCMVNTKEMIEKL